MWVLKILVYQDMTYDSDHILNREGGSACYYRCARSYIERGYDILCQWPIIMAEASQRSTEADVYTG